MSNRINDALASVGIATSGTLEFFDQVASAIEKILTGFKHIGTAMFWGNSTPEFYNGGNSYTIANNADQSIAPFGAGFLMIYESANTGASAIIGINAVAAHIVSQNSVGSFTLVRDSANKINIDEVGTNAGFRIQNKTGSSITVRVMTFRLQ